MTGRLMKHEEEKFISWAKDFAQEKFQKSVKDYAWKQFNKDHGILEKIFHLRRNYQIEIDLKNINVQFLGFANVKGRAIKLNGENLLVNVKEELNKNLEKTHIECSTYTKCVYTQYADIVGIVGFSFVNDNFSVEIKHKKSKKSLALYNIKDLKEIVEDKANGNTRSDSVHVMVILGNLNYLRKNNFETTNDKNR